MANKKLEVDQGIKIGSFSIDETTGDITTTGNIILTNGQILFSSNQALAINHGGTGATTQQAAITALTGTQTSGYYLRSNGTNATLSALSAADLTGTVSIVKGGTGQTSQQAAINALVGTQTNAYYLRSDGTNVTMSALSASDLTGTVPINAGGTGQTTASAAINALMPSQTNNSGKYLTTDGTNLSWSTVAGGGLPSVNGNAGKYLTTDGTNVSWGTISAGNLPSMTGNSGKILTTDGTDASWATITGGADTSVTSSNGTITVSSTSTLESVLSRGATSNTAVHFGNTTQSSSASTGALTVAGGVGIEKDLTVGGNLTVLGSLTTLQTANLEIDDINITLASGAVDAEAANGAGLTVDGAGATITYNSSSDSWDFNKDITTTGNATVGDLTVTGTISVVPGLLAGEAPTMTYNSITDTWDFNKDLVANTFVGNVTGNVTGDVTGNITGNASNVTGIVAIVNGGTGATDAANACVNLGLANVATSGSYSDLSGAPVLANVATSGSYLDLSNTPALANVATSGSYSDLSGTPILANVATSGNYSDLSGTPVLANVATSGSYDDLSNTPTLANVATSGNYSDLSGTPVLASVATSGSYTDLTNKPSLFSGSYTDLSNKPTSISGYGITDAYTKTEVDGLVTGLDMKQSVRAATTANITLSGTQTIDGVSIIAGDRVLVKNQTTASQNGIYIAAVGTWSRAVDADNTPGSEVTSGMYTFVQEGTTNADTGWVLVTEDTITLGTTALTFTQFNGLGQVTAGAGLTKTGSQLDIGGTAGRITVNADSVDIASTYAGQTSITTVGNITTGTWSGNTISTAYGGTGTGTAFTQGSVVFAGASGVYSQSNSNLFWDNTNNRLGVGTSAPDYKLHVIATGDYQIVAANGNVNVRLGTNNSDAQIGFYNADSTQWHVGNRLGAFSISNGTSVGNSERMRIDVTGNVGIGTSSPTSKLDVSGAVKSNYNIVTGALAAYASSTGGLYTHYTSTAGYINAVTDNSGTAGTLVLSTGSERMRINSAGRVGIATTSPLAQIDISASGGSTANAKLTAVFGADEGDLSSRTDATNKVARIGTPHYTNTQSAAALAVITSSSTENRVGIGGGTGSMNAATAIQFFTGANNTTLTGTERMRIDSSGNMGIGTTSPTNKLTVADSGSTPVAVLRTVNTASAATYVALQGYNSSNVAVTYGQIGSTIESNTASSHNGALVFATASAAALSERMRIDSSGNVGVGTTSPQGNLQVTGTGGVRITGGAGQNSYLFVGGINTSDQRLVITDVNNTENRLWGRNNVPITIYTNDVECMRINANGNLGIGTISPVAKLDIQGSTNVAAVLNQRTDVTSLSTSLMFKTAGFNYWAMRQSSGALTWYQDTAVGGTTTEYMRLTAGGNLGLGITPQNASSTIKTLEMPAGALSSYSTTSHYLMQGLYTNSSSQFVNKGTTASTAFLQSAGKFYWQTATAGTADALANSTGNLTDRMILDNTGNLGIGTTAPSTLLHIVSGDPIVTIENSASTSNARINLKNTGRTWSVAVRGADLSDSFAIRDVTASADRLVINSSGDVGIGTTSPTGKVTIYKTGTGLQTSAPQLTIQNDVADGATADGPGINFSNTAGAVANIGSGGDGRIFFSNRSTSSGTWATRVVIDSSGNVGIGTGNPAVYGKLAVLGSIVSATTDGATVSTLNTVSGLTSLASFKANGSAMTFSTSAADTPGTVTERMRIDSSGRVLIGTTTASQKLTVAGATGDGISYFDSTVRAFLGTSGSAVAQVGSTTNHSLQFLTNSTERARIDTSGRLLVTGGTTTGMSKQINVYSAAEGYVLVAADSTGDVGLAFRDQTSGTNWGGISAYNNSSANRYITISNGGEKMRLDGSGALILGSGEASTTVAGATFRAPNASGTNIAGANLTIAAGNGTGTGGSGYIAFQTAAIGSTGTTANTMTERMRLGSNGDVMIGVTSAIGGNTSFVHIPTVDAGKGGITIGNTTGSSATTNIQFRNVNGAVGSITTSGSTTAYNTSSDYRLKENIAPMTGALDKVIALNPVTYTWKSDNTAGQGFIAHELQEVVPDAVTGEKDAVDANGNPKYQGVDTSFLVATLTAAIQELKAELDSAKARIAELEAKQNT